MIAKQVLQLELISFLDTDVSARGSLMWECMKTLSNSFENDAYLLKKVIGIPIKSKFKIEQP